MSLLNLVLPRAFLILRRVETKSYLCCDQCRCSGCNVFTSIINSGKRMETLRYNENCYGKWLTYANEVLQSNGGDMHYF